MLNLEGKKTLEGRELENGKFTFKLYRAKLDNNKYVADGDALSEKTNNIAEDSTDTGETLPIWSLYAVLAFGAVVLATARKKEKEIE